MALSYDAFCVCMEQNIEAIYVDAAVYQAYAEKILQKLKDNGYHLNGYHTGRGIIFTRGIDISCCEISDPYGLY